MRAGRTEPSAAVEHVVAEVFHFQDGGVGTARERLVEMGFDHFADDNVMIAVLDDAADPALHRAGRFGQDRRTRRALVERLAGELAFLTSAGRKNVNARPF